MTKRPERIALSKRVRFEVFKRDSFTCQYCGQKAPDVVLNTDHIEPVSIGGDNSIINLITSCESCNSGKSDVPLTVIDRISKERSQLELLQARREQLQMMAEWRRGLKSIDDDAIAILCNEWSQSFDRQPSHLVMKELRLLFKRVGFEVAVDVICRTGEHYIAYNDEIAIKKMRGMEKGIIADKVRPGSSRIGYIIGIMRNTTGNQCHLPEIGRLLDNLLNYEDFCIERAVTAAKSANSTYQYKNLLLDALVQLSGGVKESDD